MLYPPILASSLPAYNYKQTVRIYFAISTYNIIGDIAQAQLTVRYQHNNRNALNTNEYPNRIKCCPITEVQPEQDEAIASTSARFYVELDPSDLVDGRFDPKLLYKVQLRFSSTSWSSTSSAANLARNASEWSTVCLLKPIEVPSIYILELGGASFKDEQMGKNVSMVFSSIEPTFTGVYAPVDASESLKSWRMRLYNRTKTQMLADSGVQLVNTYEANNGKLTFECQLPYIMTSQTAYRLVFDIETRNGYTKTKEYAFTAMAHASGIIEGKLTLHINEEEGYAQVKLKSSTQQVVHTNVTFRRTSSKSNFTIWEDIANRTITNAPLDVEFDDFTIESGVFYQYSAQLRDNRGLRSRSIVTQKKMGEFEDAFLTERGGSLDDAFQLKIKYNMNISNSAVNVGEAKTDTIGSKYPYIRRNGNMYYHSFPISFLIAVEQDEHHFFATENELRDNQTLRYREAYNQVRYGGKRLTVENGQYDYTYQREFRKKVEAFLYNNKVKLFRSLTEGNMLVKLMNITLTPNADLSRMLYSVDATAYEIDEPTIKNFDKYGIQTIGTYDPNITFNEIKVGQLNRIRNEWTNETYIDDQGEKQQRQVLETKEDAFPGGFDLMGGETGEDSLIPNIKNMFHWKHAKDGVITSDLYVSYLRIEVDSDPYLIKNENGILTPLKDNQPVDENTLLGTLINICGTTIMIEYPNRVYEMKGDNIHIGASENITPLKDTKLIVDFVVYLAQQADNSTTASTLIYNDIVGQLVDTFRPEKSFYKQIISKYYVNYYQCRNIEQPYYEKINVIYNLNIEADPGVVLYVSSSGNEKPQRLVIDESGILFIDPGINSGYITEAYFYGRNIERRWTHDRGVARPKDPSQLDTYTDGLDTYIYYDGDWYLGAPQDGGTSWDIKIEVPSIVEYYAEKQRGIF